MSWSGDSAEYSAVASTCSTRSVKRRASRSRSAASRRVRIPHPSAPARSAVATAPAAAIRRCFRTSLRSRYATPARRAATGSPWRNRSRSSASALAESYRADLSFSRHFITMASRSTGMSGSTARGDRGSTVATLLSTSSALPPGIGGSPVSRW